MLDKDNTMQVNNPGILNDFLFLKVLFYVSISNINYTID